MQHNHKINTLIKGSKSITYIQGKLLMIKKLESGATIHVVIGDSIDVTTIVFKNHFKKITYMNYLKRMRFFLGLFLFSLLVISCSDENLDITDVNEGGITPVITSEQNALLNRSTSSSGDGLSFDCFEVLYPFTLVDENGGTYVVSEDADLEILWDSSAIIVDFQYPVDIKDENDATSTINNAEELAEAFVNCLPNQWEETAFPAYLINEDNSCFELVYPINLEDAAGNLVSIADEAAFINALAADVYYFTFPLDLEDEDGNTVTANNVDDLITILLSCNDFEIDTNFWYNDSIDWSYDFEYFGCYMLSFPFDVVLSDGSTVTVNDHMEYCDLLLAGTFADFAYPLTLTDADGNQVVANSSEELHELLNACYDWNWGGPTITPDANILYTLIFFSDSTGISSDCIEINYPFTVYTITASGSETDITLADEMAFEQLPGLADGTGIYGIRYPMSVTVSGDATPTIVNSFDDLLALFSSC